MPKAEYVSIVNPSFGQNMPYSNIAVEKKIRHVMMIE